MRPVFGASNSVESCCCRSRLRSSRPNRAIRNSGIGDNELGADTLFSDGRSRENHSGVGCVAAKWTPIHSLYRDASVRPAGGAASNPHAAQREATGPPPGIVSRPNIRLPQLPFNSNRGGSGKLVRGGGVAKDRSDQSHEVGVVGFSSGASE
jgi:hypothetical protein